MVSVKKADWDEKISTTEKHKFNKVWLRHCKRILKPNGTIWVSGTMHNIYSVGHAMEELGFKIINNITWQKKNPPPNISRRAFTHSTETIIWAKKQDKKAKHLFNYSLMRELNNGKQMKDVWSTSLVKPSEKKHGYHPTQKPLEILERIILASTNEGDIVLDPFNGSGTTGVACQKTGRKYIGIDNVEDYLKVAVKRLLENSQ
jgi:site-specific DNA-methyltransferase (adenine-specific)